MATPHAKRLKSGPDTRDEVGPSWARRDFRPTFTLCPSATPLDPFLETDRGMIVFERREVRDSIET